MSDHDVLYLKVIALGLAALVLPMQVAVPLFLSMCTYGYLAILAERAVRVPERIGG